MKRDDDHEFGCFVLFFLMWCAAWIVVTVWWIAPHFRLEWIP